MISRHIHHQWQIRVGRNVTVVATQCNGKLGGQLVRLLYRNIFWVIKVKNGTAGSSYRTFSYKFSNIANQSCQNNSLIDEIFQVLI